MDGKSHLGRCLGNDALTKVQDEVKLGEVLASRLANRRSDYVGLATAVLFDVMHCLEKTMGGRRRDPRQSVAHETKTR